MSLMDPKAGPNSESKTAQLGERLDSWKEIARYLNRSVRTVYRWEKEEGLPVHRHQHKELGSVFAYTAELDAWLNARRPDAGLPSEEHQTAAPRRFLLAVALTLAAAAVVIGSTFYLRSWRSDRDGEQRSAHVAALELISSFAGSHRWPALSPDGRMVAFVSDAGGTPQVWVKNLSSGDPIQITFGDRPAVRPRWAVRGDRIIYSLQGDGIWSVAPLGGSPRRIVEQGRNADLSPDGERLVFERSGDVWVAKADGTGITPLSGLSPAVMPFYGDAWPTFSPDGRSIAVFLGEEGRYGDYWIIPSEGGTALRLTTDFAEGSAPAWTPDGKFLVFPSARAGSTNLWRVPVSGGVPEALTTGAGDDLDPVVMPDGRAVLFTNVKRTWALVVHDLKSGVRKALLERRTNLGFPRYSPDGGRIAFFERNSHGDTHLFVMHSDATNVTAVTDGVGELNIMPQWAQDGQALYFYQVRPTRTFRHVPVSGGATREIAPWSWSRQRAAAVDPRGREVLYSAMDRGRAQYSRALDLASGQETTLPVALYGLRFSRDGRWIAGGSNEGEVVVCDTLGTLCRSLTPKNEYGVPALAWSGDGTRLFFLRHTSARIFGELMSVGVEGGVPQTHGPIGPFQHPFLLWMDASPRDEIVFALCREGPYELWMAKLR
jgi:Tol biopolymer transport system component